MTDAFEKCKCRLVKRISHNINMRRYNPGFTLIEMAAVVAILGILATITLVSWSRGRAQQEVKLAVLEFQAAMRQAQGYAMAGRTDSTRIPCNYQLKFETTSQYSIIYQYKSGDVCPNDFTSNLSNPVQTFDVPNGVRFPANAWGSGGIVFVLPSGSGLSTNIDAITLQKGSATQSVCIPHTDGQFSC